MYVAFDILYRYLRQLGYDVHYVRNFTDVDDKIINRANEAGEDPMALSERCCAWNSRVTCNLPFLRSAVCSAVAIKTNCHGCLACCAGR